MRRRSGWAERVGRGRLSPVLEASGLRTAQAWLLLSPAVLHHVVQPQPREAGVQARVRVALLILR